MLFQGLEEEQLAALGSISVMRKFKRGEMIFFEGDEGDGLYMVADGQVKIFKVSFEGKEQILHIFGSGEVFGEVAVFHGRPFPASAQTLAASDILFIPRSEFVELVSKNPALAMRMLAVLSMRLRRFTTQIENLSLKEVPGRLASHLLYLVEEQGSDTIVTLDTPKGQLASLLGTSPETLSRIFAKMTEEGLIRVKGKTIHIDDMEGLKAR